MKILLSNATRQDAVFILNTNRVQNSLKQAKRLRLDKITGHTLKLCHSSAEQRLNRTA